VRRAGSGGVRLQGFGVLSVECRAFGFRGEGIGVRVIDFAVYDCFCWEGSATVVYTVVWRNSVF
jgi:hypothetical protein